jgi:hypothetical protein
LIVNIKYWNCEKLKMGLLNHFYWKKYLFWLKVFYIFEGYCVGLFLTTVINTTKCPTHAATTANLKFRLCTHCNRLNKMLDSCIHYEDLINCNCFVAIAIDITFRQTSKCYMKKYTYNFVIIEADLLTFSTKIVKLAIAEF